MKREEKTAVIDELAEELEAAEAIFAVDYRGISVPQAAELRSKLARGRRRFRVVKNRLAKRAADDAGTEDSTSSLSGPTALTLVKGDAVVAAKAISDLHQRARACSTTRAGFMDGEALDPDGFTAIARLPGLDVLHGQLVGLTAEPADRPGRRLSNMISGLAASSPRSPSRAW